MTSLKLSDYTDNLRVSPSRLALIERESSQDEVCKSHRHVILNGWLEKSYVFVLSSNTVGNVLFKETFSWLSSVCSQCSEKKKIVPLALSSHIGLGGCLRRLRECMLWPWMNSQIKDFVGQCDICLTYRDSQVREPPPPPTSLLYVLRPRWAHTSAISQVGSFSL